MMGTKSAWRKSGEWKSRYSKLYSSGRVSIGIIKPETEEPRRISFMENDSTPYTELLMKLRRRTFEAVDPTPTPKESKSQLKSILSRQSELYPSCTETIRGSLGRHDTMLLDMVREHKRGLQGEAQDQPLELPQDDGSVDSSEPCMHGFNSYRFTERSVSRSRFSRISTRRDMDIPSILAYNPSDAPPSTIPLGLPAFQKATTPKPEEIPRWSIRRSVCPVCSQKWKDRSSIAKIKNSGLKRNTFVEIPSVMAPARLRASITENSYRPAVLDTDNDLGSRAGLRNTSAAWQLTRARRIRMPKPQLPPEATAPPAVTATLNRKNLDARVNSFLST